MAASDTISRVPTETVTTELIMFCMSWFHAAL